MTYNDCRAWVSYHMGVFPSWASHMSRLPNDAKKYAMDHIADVLADVNVQDARRATDALARQENSPKLDRHVDVVAKMCRGWRERAGSRQCDLCGGTGTFYTFSGCLDDTKRAEYETYHNAFGRNPYSVIVGTPCCCENHPRPSQRKTIESLVSARGRTFEQLSQEEQDRVVAGRVQTVFHVFDENSQQGGFIGDQF